MFRQQEAFVVDLVIITGFRLRKRSIESFDGYEFEHGAENRTWLIWGVRTWWMVSTLQSSEEPVMRDKMKSRANTSMPTCIASCFPPIEYGDVTGLFNVTHLQRSNTRKEDEGRTMHASHHNPSVTLYPPLSPFEPWAGTSLMIQQHFADVLQETFHVLLVCPRT